MATSKDDARLQAGVPDAAARPKNIIVVGVPRSGTSLTSAILARKNYYVGSITRPVYRDGNDGNPFGYFEADDVIEKNVEVFKQVGYSEHNTWLRAPVPPEMVDRIAELAPMREHQAFVDDYDRHSPWLWKDPRLCLTIAYWWKLMDPETTRVILVERRLDDTLRSFQRMGWIDGDADGRQIKDRLQLHMEAVKTALARYNIPHIRLNYSDYLKDGVLTAQRLTRLCGVDISPADLNVKTELNHSSLRGRVSTWARIQLHRPPLRYLRTLRPLVPTALLAMLFPEKKFVRKESPRRDHL